MECNLIIIHVTQAIWCQVFRDMWIWSLHRLFQFQFVFCFFKVFFRQGITLSVLYDSSSKGPCWWCECTHTPGFHPDFLRYDVMGCLTCKQRVCLSFTRDLHIYVLSEGRSVFKVHQPASGNRMGGARSHRAGLASIFCCQVAARPGFEPRTLCSVDGRSIHWATPASRCQERRKGGSWHIFFIFNSIWCISTVQFIQNHRD